MDDLNARSPAPTAPTPIFVSARVLVNLALIFLVPLLLRQLRNFVAAIANSTNEHLLGLKEWPRLASAKRTTMLRQASAKR